jgi:hypothetical protein
MSATAEEPVAPTTAVSPGPAGQRLDLRDGLSVCPFLRSEDGAWSSGFASRELRCWAVRPPSQPAAHKQRELCVEAAHTSCQTYVAAMATDGIVDDDDATGASLWPSASPVPVALESVRSRGTIGGASPRTGGQALLVGLMVVALVVLVVARTTPLGGAAASAPPAGSPAPGASAAVGGSALPPSLMPTLPVTPSPAPPTASPTPTRTPKPTAAPRTYKVKAGDTIAGIAAKYHTTVKAIVIANNIVDPRTIHPGQVLIIP